MYRFSKIFQVAVVLVIFLGQQVNAQSDSPIKVEEVFSFGIAPTMGALKMDQVFGPFTRKIDQLLPANVSFRTRKTREEFYTAFADSQFDIVLIHPFDYLYSDAYGEYIPIVRKKGFLEPVFAATDKNIDSLKKLQGKIVAFPSSMGFVYEMGVRKLEELGLENNDYKKIIHGDFYSCLQSVANGSASACLSIRNIIREFTKTSNIVFYEVDQTYSIPHLVLLVHKNLAPYSKQFRQELLNLNNTEEGRMLLRLSLLDELDEVTETDVELMRQNPLARSLSTIYTKGRIDD